MAGVFEQSDIERILSADDIQHTHVYLYNGDIYCSVDGHLEGLSRLRRQQIEREHTLDDMRY